ncbi:MAG: BACON domain-containing carbohydrate-binding protein [Vicinamibacterales bacterium]
MIVTVERECDWTADPSASWIVLTAGKQGQGDGTVAYRVVENVDPEARRGSIAVSGQSVQIAQEPAPCRFSVSPAQLNVPSNGADMSIAVRTHSACSWTASPVASWATPSPVSGKGDGTVQVHIVANMGPARTGELTVAGQRIFLTQEARAQTPEPPAPPEPGPNPPGPPPPQCSYELSAGSASFTADGGTGAFRVRTSAVCPWTVLSSAPWVTIVGVPAGSGESEIRYLVAPNFSALARTAVLTIQSEVFRITQARAEELKLEGKISSLTGVCPNLRFRVDNRTVITGPDTDFRHGECSKAKNGDGVTVRGFAQPDGTVVATRVDF